jgi:hypothetical protein
MDRPACRWHAASVRFPRALIALPATLILGLTLGGPFAVADPADPPTPTWPPGSQTGQDHRSDTAEETLDRVRELVGGTGASQRSASHDSRDLTLALRDLALQKHDLSSADRKVAERFLMRPGQGSDPYIRAALPFSKCSADICVHWRESGRHAAKGSDSDGTTTPGYINKVLNTVQQLDNDYIAAGYRTPVRDGSLGGDTDKVDIYIGDIGDARLYGFCTTDDPKASDPTPDGRDVWAYCALDNDYAHSQFPANTPIENMQVTAAHEYFHAVQYAYDFREDGWLLESTATWIEDEMFDAVNDNRFYLSNGPLGAPYVPLDTFGDNFHYGTWIWWRYLTEKFPAQTGKLPKLVLDVWKRLDGSSGGPDDYSTQGLSRVLGNRNTTFKKELQLFYGVNRHPRTYYEEGNAYRATPTGLKLNFGDATTKGAQFRPSHMSSGTVKMNPKGLSQRDWKLRLRFDAPPTARGGAFVVIVYKTGGGRSTSLIRLNRRGGGSKTVPFSSRNIAHVDVIFVNTSTRFDCWHGRIYSCRGIPRDNGLLSKFSGRAFRS